MTTVTADLAVAAPGLVLLYGGGDGLTEPVNRRRDSGAEDLKGDVLCGGTPGVNSSPGWLCPSGRLGPRGAGGQCEAEEHR